jgi:UDP-glucose 4-epimerase
VVVGAAGFIGRAVVSKLMEQGCSVVGVAQPAHAEVLKSMGVEAILSSVEEMDWTSVLRPGDTVHYYAWNSVPGSANDDPARDMCTNVAPLIRLMEAMRRMAGAGRLLFTSSGGTVYGKLKDVPVPESHPLTPLTAYGAAKAAAELYLNFYRQLYGLDCRIARLSNPYGPGQNIAKGQGAVTIFMDRILRNQPLHVWGDGETIRDYIHIDDAVRGLLAVARASSTTATSWIFNLGSGRGLSINALISHLKTISDAKVDVRYDTARKFDVPTSVLDISRARIELDWQPEIDFHTGLRRTFELALAHHSSARAASPRAVP